MHHELSRYNSPRFHLRQICDYVGWIIFVFFVLGFPYRLQSRVIKVHDFFSRCNTIGDMSFLWNCHLYFSHMVRTNFIASQTVFYQSIMSTNGKTDYFSRRPLFSRKSGEKRFIMYGVQSVLTATKLYGEEEKLENLWHDTYVIMWLQIRSYRSDNVTFDLHIISCKVKLSPKWRRHSLFLCFYYLICLIHWFKILIAHKDYFTQFYFVGRNNSSSIT